MMYVHNLLLCAGIFLPGIFGATTVEWGFNHYTKYEPGDINIIITAPHGGNLNPSTQANGDSWPNRRRRGCKIDGECVWTHSCGTTSSDCAARTLNDLNTRAIARAIADEIQANRNNTGGLRPHVVYNMLSRRKLDANREDRESHEATFNISDAIKAYQDYSGFIAQAKSSITGRGLLLDIHGQGHAPPRTELGYLISRYRLNNKRYSIRQSSIRSLGEQWCGSDDACFKDFIQGNRSLGHFMNQEKLAAVPSTEQEKPNGESYFSGGYTLKTYGSRYGGMVDAIQMEFSREFRSVWRTGNAVERQAKLARKLARAIVSFCKKNYNFL
ncbi:hypothetical protein OS493_005954 [Desmophyllum pertusum]|uniref:N-formylglutamate amidohydrolase n=1 Tax=Desmophyllum pertusum TaxID=174260 RepID=A0A9W9YH76_9CNID|nr:hypothetical protein OS493_005954 [Desmophyllum pertusum]